MQAHEKIKLEELGILNPLVRDYIEQKEDTRPLYRYAPSIVNIDAVMNDKTGFRNREILHKALKKQYEGIEISDSCRDNLDLLQENNTFTVCTAHQLCLFTGPSYFIYKILSAIKLAKILKEKHPKNNFVPVYWMGSEDHDFEEINHAHVYGKTITWEHQGQGAVGPLSLDGIQEVINYLSEILGDKEEAKSFIKTLENNFSNKTNYGKAFQTWILDLFKDFGLIVLDQNDALLKSTFKDVIEDELLQSKGEKALKTNEEYLNANYHVQASSRPINFFYLKGNLRERLERKGELFTVLNTDITFTKEALLKEIEAHPERFSPNVILRPIYQETVLPNVAFIGGPGEVSYWLQLKNVFEAFHRTPPMILLRDMAVVMQKSHLEKLASWDITVAQLFSSYDQIAKTIVEEESTNELSLAKEKEDLEVLFAQIKEKAIAIDKNMDRSVEGEKQKVLNAFANMESKLIRAEKKNFEQKLNQLDNIQSKLLPNNTLQERYDNFIPVYLKNQEEYFDSILEEFNAFDKSLKVFQ